MPPGGTTADTGESAGAGDTVARTPQQDHTTAADDDATAAREPSARPIVPAFPARTGREGERAAALKRVHFGFDKWNITPEAARVLDANARWLREHPGLHVRVEGHTDERGTSEYNLSLGERRAKSVRAYLLQGGVGPERIETVSYGEEVPLADGANERAWALNRRAEFAVVERSALRGGAATRSQPAT